MPHPKRRHSNHRTGIRRAHLALEPRQLHHCARCGSPGKPHCVCENCGYYGFKKGADKQGQEVFVRDDF